MATCKLCGRSGFFLSTNQSGLCKNCDAIISIEIQSRVRVVIESINLVNKSKTLETRLSRCDVILENANALKRFEQIGIPTTNPPPSRIAEDFASVRKRIVLESLRGELEEGKRKADVALTVKSKMTILSKVLIRIRQFAPHFPSREDAISIEKEVAALITEHQLAGYLSEARRVEFKGNQKGALSHYYDALYLLRHDDVDDERQAQTINSIEIKIRELSPKNSEKIG